jgi:predicted phage-related endonuclease
MTEREKFLAERQLGCGGSDAASLFNLGWGCQRRLWYDKTAAEKNFEFEQTKAVRLGNLMEPWFAAEYAAETGNAVDMRAVFSQDKAAHIAVHIDAWVHARSRAMGVAEIKSCGRGAWHKYRREGLPEDYVLQLQTGMGVTGCLWGVFIIGCRDSGEILHWEVDFRPEIYTEILAAAAVFWKDLKAEQNPYERLEPDDKRCASCSYRTTCQGEHISLAAAGLTAKDGYEMDNSILPLLIERAERSALKKEAENLFDETNEEIKARLGDRKLVCTEQGHKVQYYSFHKAEYVVKAHDERPLRVYAPKGEK